MAQPAHPQPQEVLPFRLPHTIPAMTDATAISRTRLTTIVATFSIIHVNIHTLLSQLPLIKHRARLSPTRALFSRAISSLHQYMHII